MALETAGLEWINKNLSGFVNDIDRGNRAMAGVGDSAERSSGKLNLLGSVITGVATAMTTFALDAVVKVGQAFVGLGVSSVQLAGDFQSMTTAMSIAASAAIELGETSFDQLHDAALEVGGDVRLVGVSATQSADSITGLYKAGLTTAEIFGDLNSYMEGTTELGGALRASIDLAAATELDMAAASDLAAITLATFGGELETETERAEFINAAMNNFVQAADASVASVTDLADGLGNVGPTAAAFGFELEDTNNALAILSTRGISGAEAGTVLKSMLTGMMRETPKVTEAMEELGISLYDTSGQMYSLPEIIAQLQIGMEGLTEQQRNSYIQTIAGTYGMKAMQTLMDEGVDGWYAMADATEHAAGIQMQAAAKAATYAGQMEAMQGTIETLKIRIGEALLPTMTSLINAFSEMVDQHGPKIQAVFEGIANVLQPLIQYLADVVVTGDLLNDFFTELPAPVQGFIESVQQMIDVVEGGQGVFAGIMELLDDFLPEETIVRLWTFRDTVVGAFSAVQEWTTTNWPIIRDTVLDAVGGIKDWFTTNWPIIQAAVQTAWEVIGDVIGAVRDVIVEDVWPSLQSAFTSIGETIETLGIDWSDVWNAIKKALGIVAVAIGAILLALVGTIVGIVNAIASALETLTETWENVTSAVRGIIEGFAEWFAGAMEIVQGILTLDFKRAGKGFIHAWKGIYKYVKNLGKLIYNAIVGPFKLIYKFIAGFVKGIVNFFKNLKKRLVGSSIVVDMMDKIKSVITDTLEKVAKVVIKILDKIADTFERVLSSIADFVERIFGDISGTIEKVMTFIEDFIEDTMKSIKDTIKTVTEAIKKIWTAFADALEDAWESLWDAVEDALDAAKSALKSTLNSLVSTLTSIWESFTDALEAAWSTLWLAVETAVITAVTTVGTALDNFVSSLRAKWDTFIAGLSTAWDTFWAGLSTGVTAAWDSVIVAIDAGLERIRVWLTTNIAKARALGSAIVDGISTGLTNAWDLVTTAVGGGLDKLRLALTSIGTLWGKVKTLGVQIVNGLKSGLSELWNDATQGVVALFSRLLSALGLSDIWNNIASAGRRIVDALISGIKSHWQNFIDWLLDAITGIFGSSEPTNPQSPFRTAFMSARGAETMERFVAGMMSQIPAMEAQFRSAAGSVQPISPVMSSSTSTSTVNDRRVNIEINPTYEEIASPSSIYYDVTAALAAAVI